MASGVMTRTGTAPLVLADAKLYMNIDASFTADDTMIQDLIDEAIELTETLSRKYLQPVTYQLQRREWYDDNDHYVRFPFSPVRSITSVQYVDADGNTQALDAANYYLDRSTEEEKLRYISDIDYPTLHDDRRFVTVSIAAGYDGNAPDILPKGFTRVLKYLVTDFYAQRYNAAHEKMSIAEKLIGSIMYPGI